MNTMRIDILNSKVVKLLKDRGDQNSVAIQDMSKSGLKAVFQKLHSRAKLVSTLKGAESARSK